MSRPQVGRKANRCTAELNCRGIETKWIRDALGYVEAKIWLNRLTVEQRHNRMLTMWNRCVPQAIDTVMNKVWHKRNMVEQRDTIDPNRVNQWYRVYADSQT